MTCAAATDAVGDSTSGAVLDAHDKAGNAANAIISRSLAIRPKFELFRDGDSEG